MSTPFWTLNLGPGPIIAVANHHGHALRSDVAELSALGGADRLREEDPYTAEWASISPTHLIANYSRFQVDLNRPRENAVYLTPHDAWGLNVWSSPPPQSLIDSTLAEYDAYYAELERVCREKERQYGGFVMLDLHSYNHRRMGPEGPTADPQGNPEVNIGTGTMDRHRWGGLVDRFMHELSGFDCLGCNLDVRENVKFVGRQFPKWVHSHFPKSGCAIAIEFKKFFMDEWTGELNDELHAAIREALLSTLPGLEEELGKALSQV